MKEIIFSFDLDISIIREDSPAGDTTITTCTATSAGDDTLSESRLSLDNKKQSQLRSIDVGTTNGVINHAYSTDTLYNQLPIVDSASSVATISPNPPVQQQTRRQILKQMGSIICELMRNTRYIFIVIANLFEGILLKGKVIFIFIIILKLIV